MRMTIILTNSLKKRQSVNYFCLDSSHYSADLTKHIIASGFSTDTIAWQHLLNYNGKITTNIDTKKSQNSWFNLILVL